jgi:formylglycine-generating enzyme required for sulfatase activity
MGSDDGDPDERPVHPRRLDAFWITDVPLSWTAFCIAAGYTAAPGGKRPDHADIDQQTRFVEAERRKIRLQYCADDDAVAVDWHRNAARPPAGWSKKPMVAVAVADAARAASRLGLLDGATYALPSEAEWEKAARGGLAGARYAWGEREPSSADCDFQRMGDYRLLDPRRFPANGYGLHGVCGGVWEWTADRYDALAYHRAARGDTTPVTPTGADHPFVIRGGSFTDCAASVTVSFRASRPELGADVEAGFGTPNIGFRLVRRVTP